MTAAPLASFVERVAARRSAPFRHVYVHYPFCLRKCPYCDFNSHAGRDAEIDPYLDALIAEARAWAPLARPETLFVGGGTPTYARADRLERYLLALREVFGGAHVTEWTVEANPGSLDLAKVRALRRAGVGRVSMGAQSFHPRHLATLGRAHDAADTVRSVEILRAGGVGRLSLDLILAIPGQTLAEQARDLQRAVDLTPDHVSAYVLTFEPGTPFETWRRAGRLPTPEADRELAHLHLARDALTAAGLARYEISNFARAGAESRHNLAYWRGADWLALGAGAHGHAAGLRWRNVDDPAAYAAAIAAGHAPVATEETVAAPSRVLEMLMMGLRLADGVDLAEVARRTGLDVGARHGAAIRTHVEAGRLVEAGSRLRLTEAGLDVIDAVLLSFVPAA